MISDLNTVTWKRGFLKVRDCWYDNIAPELDADVVYVTQRKKPEGDEHYEQYTILIDLLQNETELTGAISKNCLDKIKRTSKKTEYNYKLFAEPDGELIDKFTRAYNAFADWKKIAPVENLRLGSLHKFGLIMISVVYENEVDVVCWHVYRVNKERVFLIYTFTNSFSHVDTTVRNNLGMVNRNCHYNDMLEFKKLGVASYDFGGWYNGEKDAEKLNINKFKEEFGGKVVENYNCIYYPTIKGKVFKTLKHLRSHAENN